ncbi:MAG: cellulase family glycosylhydrolase [Paludibacteraceae bacterium]|nr:cellulase family glycosylhydrolase [Paludibacteraceae bacterium]
MKKLFLLLASAFCLNASAALSDTDFGSNNYIDEWGRLKLVGNQLSSESGQPVQLKGWSSFSTHYPEVGGCLTVDQFKQMKTWGANIVRMAMYLNDYGGYMSNKADETKKMKEFIEYAKEAGIYCMVDWHVLQTPGGQSGDPNTYLTDAKNFFSEISKYVKDKGYKHVIYEICNEPDQKPWSNIKNYANALLPSIAANDPNAVVIVGTPSWDQQILDPVTQGKVTHETLQIMYAFHYYACSHEGLLGNFRSATASIPVFVSEWSGVTFNGDGALCQSAADKLLGYCSGANDGKQVVSWCFWNWGHKNEGSSTFNGSCSANSLTSIGNYIVGRMGGDPSKLVPIEDVRPYKVQTIPAPKDSPFQIGYYDFGGEGISYHDGNGGTFEKNKDGDIIGYKKNDPAKNEGKEEELNCNASVSYGNKFRLGEVVDTFLYGKQWTGVPDVSDNCVDVTGCFGPGEENAGWYNIGWTEQDEWMNYTINVEQAGYYKVSACTNYASSGASYFTLMKMGPKGGCLVRDVNNKTNYELSELYLTPLTKCQFGYPADDYDNNWMCWEWNDVTNIDEEQAYVLFTETGEQKLKFLIGPASIGDVGPLAFEFVEGIENAPEDDPLFRESTEVSKVVANSGSIYSVENGIITISANEAGSATISTAAGTSKVVNIAKGDNKINVAPGLYIVNLTTASNSKAVKVLVK